MHASPVRVLVVDDSALYRKFIRDVLEGAEGIEVVGTAHNGQSAMEKIAALKPDLLTLDLEMPGMGGIDVLNAIRLNGLSTGAIMCSSVSSVGAAITTSALELGAFDFVLKPTQSANAQESIATLKGDLLPKIQAFVASRRRAVLPKAFTTPASVPPSAAPPTLLTAVPAGDVRSSQLNLPKLKPDIVVIGVSTGGPAALSRIVPMFPADFPVPILIVQHMPPMFTKSLADDLGRRAKLKVSEGMHGDQVRAGNIFIAPGGKQMKVEFGPGGFCLKITDDAPERNCKPSVDYLFRSVANNYGGKVLGVILTGMGDDGTEGCRELKKCRATVWAQDEASCVVYGMPRSVAEQNLVDQVFTLDQFPEAITRFVSRKVDQCR